MIDPSDANHQRGQVLRLTMNSMSGKAARACYDTQNRIDASIATNRARLFFSLSKANATPGFTNKMDKAIKKLIVQSGGAARERSPLEPRRRSYAAPGSEPAAGDSEWLEGESSYNMFSGNGALAVKGRQVQTRRFYGTKVHCGPNTTR